MTSEIPTNPTGPFDATGLSDLQVLRLTDIQRLHAVLSPQQLEMEGNARPPYENRPEQIPSPENLDQIRSLFDWVDYMHKTVRGPSGMAWVQVRAMLASLDQIIRWAESDPPIQPRYRYRIDTPMDPHPDVPDHLPKEWT